jgi:hypothetical protein
MPSACGPKSRTVKPTLPRRITSWLKLRVSMPVSVLELVPAT